MAAFYEDYYSIPVTYSRGYFWNRSISIQYLENTRIIGPCYITTPFKLHRLYCVNVRLLLMVIRQRCGLFRD